MDELSILTLTQVYTGVYLLGRALTRSCYKTKFEKWVNPSPETTAHAFTKQLHVVLF